MRIMTICGTGVDIESIARFRGMERKKDKRFFSRIYTKSELDYCFSKKDPAQHLAVRFAAKEAVVKALHQQRPFTDIEVRLHKSGAPFVHVKKSSKRIHLSMSHCDEYAVAYVIAES